MLPGTTQLQWRIYLLSQTEYCTMKEYIQEALQQGYIVPRTCPVSAGFFSMDLKRRRSVNSTKSLKTLCYTTFQLNATWSHLQYIFLQNERLFDHLRTCSSSHRAPRCTAHSWTFKSEILVTKRSGIHQKLVLLPMPNDPGFYPAELLFQHVCIYFRVPEDIVCDKGPQITSRVWHNFMEKLGITGSLTSEHQPQSNRQGERVQPRVWTIPQNILFWKSRRLWAKYTQDSLHHAATSQLTPFQYMLGYQPWLLPWNANPTKTQAIDEWFQHR